MTKTYAGPPPVRALHGVSVEVQPGERLAVVGPSGSGKSTLLNILGLLDGPTSGTVTISGRDVGALSAAERDRVRAESLGFVFQEHHVLGHRTVEENLRLKLAVSTVPRADWATVCARVLDDVGLGHRRRALGRLLSGGEKQRLAVARAVIGTPAVLLADEPTGNLDAANGQNVLTLLDAQAARDVAVVVITHDMVIASWADRVVRIDEGRVQVPPVGVT